MSSSEYLNTYKYMSDSQRDAMSDLYMKGVNYDIEGHGSHVWVTYTDVEETVAKLLKKSRISEGLD